MVMLLDAGPTASRVPRTAHRPSSLARRRPPARLRVSLELALIGVFYVAYTLIRNAVPDHAAVAQRHASTIWEWEQHLGIAVERTVNHAVHHVTWLAVAMNYYYATLHFAVTLTVLVWLFRRHPHHFPTARTTLLVTTALALVCFYLYPLAPPRLMTGGGFVDTVIVHGTWGSMASPQVAGASNQYAAMPSMHFGWSLWCGLAIALLARRWWARLLGVVYPAATLLVIVGTANHFWLDAVGGGVCVAAGAVVATAIYYQRAGLRGGSAVEQPLHDGARPARGAQVGLLQLRPGVDAVQVEGTGKSRQRVPVVRQDVGRSAARPSGPQDECAAHP